MWLKTITTKTVKVSVSFIPHFFSSLHTFCSKPSLVLTSFVTKMSQWNPSALFSAASFYWPMPLQNIFNRSCSDSISQTNDCWRDNERVGEAKMMARVRRGLSFLRDKQEHWASVRVLCFVWDCFQGMEAAESKLPQAPQHVTLSATDTQAPAETTPHCFFLLISRDRPQSPSRLSLSNCQR